jgi:hypothetical protein
VGKHVKDILPLVPFAFVMGMGWPFLLKLVVAIPISFLLRLFAVWVVDEPNRGNPR